MSDSSEIKNISIQPDTLALKEKARQEGLETVWERHAAQEPRCGFCDLGLSCRICVMGPCRIDPFGEGPQKGVCGARVVFREGRHHRLLRRGQRHLYGPGSRPAGPGERRGHRPVAQWP